MLNYESRSPKEVPRLVDLASRIAVLQIFKANVRWRQLRDIIFDLKMQMDSWKLPCIAKKQICEDLTKVFRELTRWTEKHVQMFPETSTSTVARRKRAGIVSVHRGEHLRLFYDYLVWQSFGYLINDLETAKKIATIGCYNWPMMKFQFACCYAITDLLYNSLIFDKVRRSCFRKQLDGHAVYDFWLIVLDNAKEWNLMFCKDRIIMDQRLVLVFQFAIVNGYIELVKHIWTKLTQAQEEAIGFLWWKKICFNARHREMLHFLCQRLCTINLNGMARLTWNSFYHKVYLTLQGDEFCSSQKKENLQQLACLLENFCPQLRMAMLRRENYKVITDTFLYNRIEAFSLLLKYLDRSQLSVAREQIDRFYDKRRTQQRFTNFRNMMTLRQLTIE